MGAEIFASTGSARSPGGSAPRANFGRLTGLLVGTAQSSLQHAVGDLPLLQRVELERDRILEVAGLLPQRDLELLSQESPHGMPQEAFEPVEADLVICGKREWLSEERGGIVTWVERCPGAGEVQRVEAPRGVADQGAALVVPGVERLQRVRQNHDVTRLAARHRHRVVDHVQQLADRHGGWTRQIGPLVASRVGHHEVVPRRQDRVEQQLPILAAHVAVSHPRITRGEVIPVALDMAGKAAVV